MTSLFGHSVRSELLLLYVLEAVAGFAVVYALLTLGIAHVTSANPGGDIAFAATLAICSGLISGASGVYQPEALSRAGRLLARTAVASLLLLLASLALGLVLRDQAEDTSWASLAAVLLASAAAVATTRLGFAAAARGGFLQRRIAVVQGAAAGQPGREQHYGAFDIALTVTAGEALAVALAPARLRARRIWAVVAEDPAALPEAIRRTCRQAGVRVFGDAEFRERRLNRVDLDRLPADWLATTCDIRETRIEAAVRRGFDLAIGAGLLLLTLPLLLLTALAIKLDSPGPVFYRQERVGRGGRVFTLFKFRSMVVDAEAGGTPRWATRRDPRVTGVGRLIRLTRIDEVPQVLNVLRGDMAFVGPRPERPAFVEQLGQVIPHYGDRASVKPGITGWAQVNYPYGASVEDARQKLSYDLYYVRRRSLFLDLLILVATVRVVLFQEGAR